MEQTVTGDLFEIKVNSSGKNYIRKFAFFSRVMILIGIVISAIHMASTLVLYFTFDETAYTNYPYYILLNKILPYYTVVYCVVFYLLMYAYWQVGKFMKKGLKYNDEQTFNKAFQALFRYAVIVVLSLMLSVMSYGFELFLLIKYHL